MRRERGWKVSSPCRLLEHTTGSKSVRAKEELIRVRVLMPYTVAVINTPSLTGCSLFPFLNLLRQKKLILLRKLHITVPTPEIKCPTEYKEKLLHKRYNSNNNGARRMRHVVNSNDNVVNCNISGIKFNLIEIKLKIHSKKSGEKIPERKRERKCTISIHRLQTTPPTLV